MAKYVIEKRFSNQSKPRRRDKLAQLLAFAGIETAPEAWLGAQLVLVALFAVVGLLLPFSVLALVDLQIPLLKPADLFGKLVLGIAIAILFSLIAIVMIYMHLYYLIADRTKRVDKVLPDFLLMVSANLRSGMTPFAAFQAAARPEFGPLQTEITYVSSRSLGSESFTDALRELTNSIDSGILRRMVSFFENELKSGGRLAYLLETSADEIRENEDMKREMMLATKSYAIFLGFILVLGLPLLLGISTQFLSMFAKFQSNISMAGQAGIGLGSFSAPSLSIDASFIDNMAIVIIVGSSFLTSLLIGIIMEGKFLYGAKYFPPIAAGSLTAFWLFKSVISGFIGPLF